MRRTSHTPRLLPESRTQVFILAALILVAGIAVVGPTGILAWGENRQLLAERRAELEKLTEKRDELRNRVDLLDPAKADPDLVGELLRRNLNVAHPDEIVVDRR